MMWSQVFFSDFASPTSYFMTNFHSEIMSLIVFILGYMMWLLLYIGASSMFSIKMPVEGHALESIWTMMPCLMLTFMALPSLYLLYLLEDYYFLTSMLVKITGNQWYWTYEITESWWEYDSFAYTSLYEGDTYSLELDNPLPLLLNVNTRIIITASDVLHSWTVPALGVKVDAIPGRMNQAVVTPWHTGTLYGQCSELCGMYHSFMPICVEVGV